MLVPGVARLLLLDRADRARCLWSSSSSSKAAVSAGMRGAAGTGCATHQHLELAKTAATRPWTKTNPSSRHTMRRCDYRLTNIKLPGQQGRTREKSAAGKAVL